jgi:hypothetical protein
MVTKEKRGVMMKIKNVVIAIVGVGISAVAICVPTASAASAAPPQATTADLEVWLGLGQGGAAAGSIYYPLEFTNISGHTVTIRGYPGVSAVNETGQLGSAASWDGGSPTVTVTLANRATAHTVLRFVNVSNFGDVETATATALNIYPPGQKTSAQISYSFPALVAKGPIYLGVVAPIRPEVGIPGNGS